MQLKPCTKTFDFQVARKLCTLNVLDLRIVCLWCMNTSSHNDPNNSFTNKHQSPQLDCTFQHVSRKNHGFDFMVWRDASPKPSASGGPNSKRPRSALEQLEAWASEWPMQDRVVDAISFEEKDRSTKLHLVGMVKHYLKGPKEPKNVWPRGLALGFDIFAVPKFGRVALSNVAQLLV